MTPTELMDHKWEVRELRAEIERLRETLHSILDSLRSQNARLRAAWDDVGIGGNHLANFLIHRLGGDFASHYAPSDKGVPAALGKIDPEALDVWYCWAALMRARDALEQSAPQNPVSKKPHQPIR